MNAHPDGESSEPISPKAHLYTNVCSQASGSGASGSGGRADEVPEKDEEPEKERAEDEVIDEVEFAEGAEVKVRPIPKGPSAEQLRIHNATHVPFRSWCPKCVSARGHQSAHRASPDPTDSTPMISFDYCFLRRGENEGSVPVLVGKVRKYNFLIAHVVPFKGGAQEVVVAQVVRDISKLGFHGKVILKCDQEPAIESLLREVARARGNRETLIEHSPVRDSSGNGLAEKGVQTLESIVRTHVIDLDDKLGEKLALDQPWFCWLVEHAADLHNWYQIGVDGRTPWERVKGCQFSGSD